jgi:signal transduction histidine kinase/ligand-binding sensor domain-containing protein
MRKGTLNYFLLIIFFASASICTLEGCNSNQSGITFPYETETQHHPVSEPLQLGKEKKLNWHVIRSGGIKPEVKKLDIEGLPALPYDSTGYKPMTETPEISHFDFNTLPSAKADISKIASQPLAFKTYLLTPNAALKANPIAQKNGTTISISEIGAAQGLTEKKVYGIIKDRNGFIWIAAEKGIYRYDGENMQLLSPYRTVGLVEDNDGKIWYINTSYIGFIDLRKGLITASATIHTVDPQLPKMIVDEKGSIWVSRITTGGAVIINPSTLTYKNLASIPGIANEKVWALYEDAKKNIWVTGTNGVNIIDQAVNKIIHLAKSNGLGSDTTSAITKGDNGKIWIACKNNGVSAVDPDAGTITSYNAGIHNVFTYRLLNDDKGRIWIATSTGLSILDPVKNRVKYFVDKDGIPEDYTLDLLQDNRERVWVASYTSGLNIIEQGAEMTLPDGAKSLSALMEDSKGRIWIGAGTSNDGIVILDLNKKLIRHLKKEQGLSDDWIQAFLEVGDQVWFTTNLGGFEMIDPVRKTISHIGKKQGLTSDSLYSIINDLHGNIWFTGPALGLDVIDSAWQTVSHTGIADGLSDNNIVDIKADMQGRIWIANYSKGIDIIDPKKGTIQNLSQGRGLSDSCYRILLPDSSGRMWIGTDKGIYIADLQSNTLTTITTKEGLSDNYINALGMYQGSVIAGTYHKVTIITPPSDFKINSFPSKDTVWKIGLLAGSEGLVNTSNVWSTNIVTKDGKYLWADLGLTIINHIKEKNDSAPSTHITAIKDMNESLSFTNTTSLNEKDTIWNDEKFFVKGQQLPLAYAQQHAFSWDSIYGPYGLPANLRIPHDQNYLQFQFAQANLGVKDATLYSYILEGIDKTWSTPATATTTENYLNLPPGKYTFRVRSKFSNGHWSEPAEFNFAIVPPWWETWWAYTLYALVFFGAVGGFIYYRSQRLLKENRILEDKVEHRTNQLKQSIEELKATQTQLVQSEKMASLGELTAGIAHEIQNPLNFVNNFSELSVELAGELKEGLNNIEIDPAKKSELESVINDLVQNQEKINFHGKRADAIVKGMLQHSRSTSGIKELTDINALADEYFRLSYHGLRAKDKSFNAKTVTDFDPNVEKINVVSQDLGRVILNLITNAFYSVSEKKKMNIQGYDPTVWVTTRKMNGKTEIRVRDNGMGVPQKALDKIFQPFFTTKPVGQGTGLGLSLSYDITKAHGGDLKVETKEGEGAEFIIQLPS